MCLHVADFGSDYGGDGGGGASCGGGGDFFFEGGGGKNDRGMHVKVMLICFFCLECQIKRLKKGKYTSRNENVVKSFGFSSEIIYIPKDVKGAQQFRTRVVTATL